MPAQGGRPAPAGAALRPARAQRAAAAAPHRVRARAAAQRRRSDAQPLPRSLPPSLPGAVLSGLGAGAAARQPRSPRRRPLRRLHRRVHRRRRRRRSATATPCPTSPSSFTSARSSGTCATPKGCARSCEHFFRVPVRIEEFVGHWLALGAGERTYLGREGARSARGAVARRPRLGSPAQVPHSPRAADARRSTRASCPAALLLRKLVDWVRLYLCFELDWDVRLVLEATRCRR